MSLNETPIFDKNRFKLLTMWKIEFAFLFGPLTSMAAQEAE
jgi:hypothetical protein